MKLLSINYRGYFHVSLFTNESQGDSPSQKEHHFHRLFNSHDKINSNLSNSEFCSAFVEPKHYLMCS